MISMQKVLIAVVSLLLFIFVWPYVMRWAINSPPFIQAKLHEFRTNDALLDSMGSSGNNWKTIFNRNDYENHDTVRFTITIGGTRKSLFYEGVEVFTGNDWKLLEEKLTVK